MPCDCDPFNGPEYGDDTCGDYPDSMEVTCRICEAEGLEWEGVDGQWLLHEPDGTVHRCPETTGEFVFDPDMGFRPK